MVTSVSPNDSPEPLVLPTSSEHLREVVEQLGHPVFVKDRAFRFVLVNQALCDLVGRTSAELIGKTDYDFFPADQADSFRSVDTEVLREGSSTVIDEESLTDQGGAVHVLRTVKKPLRDPASGEIHYLVGIITDVTRTKAAEQALRQANEELERRVRERTAALEAAQAALVRKERLAVLGQLAASLAHQIRNPLAAISAASSILKRKLARSEDPEIGLALGAILEEVWTANRIITDLVDYARVKSPARVDIEVNELLDEAIREAPCPEGVTIERDVQPGLRVEVDIRQTRDAIASVIRNGYEAMPRGGRLLVVAVEDGAHVLVAIEDSGPGLTREAIAGLFEPLVTSKPLGLGLGLATARLLLENQKGSIRAATQRGGGARFEIRLPVPT